MNSFEQELNEFRSRDGSHGQANPEDGFSASDNTGSYDPLNDPSLDDFDRRLFEEPLTTSHRSSVSGPPTTSSYFEYGDPFSSPSLTRQPLNQYGARTPPSARQIASAPPQTSPRLVSQQWRRGVEHTVNQQPTPYVDEDNGRDQHHSESAQQMPSIQGIQIVPTRRLPDRFRSLFPFPNFNAVQSKCFDTVFNKDDNVVVSSPTGSGKTVILELAICHLVSQFNVDQLKIVYQAPTKALCNERFRDWSARLSPLGLVCTELTGDTEQFQLPLVQRSNIIITTPEKWDSITRKWKDYRKLIELIKLFLIDEVHILGDTRGATLEAVVSRMKTISTSIRFVALSATIPNSEDIATWLGKNQNEPHLPAYRQTFGEEFRPVTLQKVVYGYAHSSNDFAFDKSCNPKLLDLIKKHSIGKPILVFCITRKSVAETAKCLANFWAEQRPYTRPWPQPRQQLSVTDKDLRDVAASGVAFHHAGLDPADRGAIEQAYIAGDISVICCTSTLAVGINLPCHMVILKGTSSWQGTGIKEYSDLEVMQMLGRAGRPQFDRTATAIIMTRSDKQQRYEKMVSGEQLVESCLHLNLIEHLNAEIVLGLIVDLASAQTWLKSTFFFVRLLRNPGHYKLQSNGPLQSLSEMLLSICERDIALLSETQLIEGQQDLKSTEFGVAMARYCVKFETMKTIVSLSKQAKVSELILVISQANEFNDIRMRAPERSLFKAINKTDGIKYPIQVDVALTAHKVSLLIQSELGNVDYPAEEMFQKHRTQLNQDKQVVFSHVQRLIRCIIDCNIELGDSISVRNGLELNRSVCARAWDSSPLIMKQIPNIGIVAVRKLLHAGIRDLEALDLTEPHKIEMIVSRNAPFGNAILAHLKKFPKLRVEVKMTGKIIEPSQPVKIQARAEIGFLNEETPSRWLGRLVMICFVAETSSGVLVEFRRMAASTIGKGLQVFFTATLLDSKEYILCHVSCESLAGTMQSAELHPNIPASLFPKLTAVHHPQKPVLAASRQTNSTFARGDLDREDDEYGGSLEDDELLAAEAGQKFVNIDDFDTPSPPQTAGISNLTEDVITSNKALGTNPVEHNRLPNGRWECGHTCKDKTKCKHFCCREGLDKIPRRSSAADRGQKTLNLSVSKPASFVDKPSKVIEKSQPKVLGAPSAKTAHGPSQSTLSLTSSLQMETRSSRPGLILDRSAKARPGLALVTSKSQKPELRDAISATSDTDMPSLSYSVKTPDSGRTSSTLKAEDTPSRSHRNEKQKSASISKDIVDEFGDFVDFDLGSSDLEQEAAKIQDNESSKPQPHQEPIRNRMTSSPFVRLIEAEFTADYTEEPATSPIFLQRTSSAVDNTTGIMSSSPPRSKKEVAKRPMEYDFDFDFEESRDDQYNQSSVLPTKKLKVTIPELSDFGEEEAQERPLVEKEEVMDDRRPGSSQKVKLDMEGIDPDIFAEFADYVDFV